MKVHIVDCNAHPRMCDEGVTVVIALCSEVGYLLEDGNMAPDDFDFVGLGDPNYRQNATCQPCLDEDDGLLKEKAHVEGVAEGVG